MQGELKGNRTSSNNHGKHWVVRMVMTRHRLCIWRKTTESQKDLEKPIDKLIAYVLHARRLRVKLSYTDSDVIAIDETVVL